MIVRCIDNLFQTDVLVEGREYEVRAERDDCYILSGFDKGFSKTRFEIAKRCAAEPGSSRWPIPNAVRTATQFAKADQERARPAPLTTCRFRAPSE
jgi:hypothetical protein